MAPSDAAAPRPAWRFAAAAAAALVLVAIARAAFVPYYDTNDDPAMRLIAEGRVVPGSTPQATILFVNPLLGWLIVAGHAWLPGRPWYDIVLFACELLAIAASVFVLLRRPNPAVVVSIVALLASFWLTGLVRVQFTIVAGHLAAAGCLLIADLLLEEQRRPRATMAQAIAGTALVFIGGLVRWHIAVMIVALAIPLALPFAFAAPAATRRRSIGAALLALALCAVSLSAGRWLDNLFYRLASPGWANFHQYGAVRARLTEWAPTTPGARTLATMHDEAGWSANDVEMLQSWLGSNRELFGLERLERAAAILRIQEPPFSPRATIDEMRSRAPALLAQARGDAAPAVMLLALLCLGWGQWRQAVYALYAAAIVAAAVVVVPVFFKTMPFRVLWPILTLAAVFVTRYAGGLRPTRIWVSAAVAVLLCAAAWPVVRDLHLASEERAERSVLVSKDVTALNHGPRRTYVVQGSGFPFESYFQPLRPTPPAEQIDLVPLGASAQTPIIQGFIQRHGIRDLMLTFCTDDHYRMIAKSCALGLVERFVDEHFHLPVRIAADFEGQTFTTCRCAAAPNP